MIPAKINLTFQIPPKLDTFLHKNVGKRVDQPTTTLQRNVACVQVTGGSAPLFDGVICWRNDDDSDWDTGDAVKVRAPDDGDIAPGHYVGISQGGDSDGNTIYVTAGGGGGRLWFLALLTKYAKRNGCWLYAFNGPLTSQPHDKCHYLDCGQDGTPGCIDNDVGAWVSVSETRKGGAGVTEVQTVCIHDATSGTFDLTIYDHTGAGSTITVQFDGSDLCSQVPAMAGGISCTVSGTNCWDLEYLDQFFHKTAEPDVTLLKPGPKNTATEWRNIKIPDSEFQSANPLRVLLTTQYVANMKTSFKKTQTGDEEELSTMWEIWFDDVCGGKWILTTDEGDTDELDWDIAASDLADAINAVIGQPDCVTVSGSGTKASPWQITYACDMDDHDFSMTTEGDTLHPPLFDCTEYGFGWWLGDGGGDGGGGCTNGKTGSITYVTDVAVFCNADTGAIEADVTTKTSHFDHGCWTGES